MRAYLTCVSNNSQMLQGKKKEQAVYGLKNYLSYSFFASHFLIP